MDVSQDMQQLIDKKVEQAQITTIRNLTDTLQLTPWQAMDAMRIPADEQQRYACLLHPGNQEQYDPPCNAVNTQSPLAGKRILFLGSSVTFGAASLGISFADDLCARNDSVMIKEAVSGTTLVDNGPDSYVARLRRLDTDIRPDLFVCQLSTNDASQSLPLGTLSTVDSYDTSTVVGAVEFIISYVRATWDCPIVFYTSPRFDSEPYTAMVELLKKVAEKWDIWIIDMWHDNAFNDISEAERTLYMADPIHPTKAGYLLWWTPYMEKSLLSWCQSGML